MHVRAVLVAVVLTLSAFPSGTLARDIGAALETPAAKAPINRFARVDTRLYRGGQPDAKGYAYLRDLGIDTIVSLRKEPDERALVESLGMKFVHIPVTFVPFGSANDLPQDAVTQFFKVVDDPANGEVFVHCQRGADRTGAFVGLYRMTHQGWNVDRAFKEARDVGMRFWYSHMKPRMEALAVTLTPSALVTQ